jgi:hypothetical protein
VFQFICFKPQALKEVRALKKRYFKRAQIVAKLIKNNILNDDCFRRFIGQCQEQIEPLLAYFEWLGLLQCHRYDRDANYQFGHRLDSMAINRVSQLRVDNKTGSMVQLVMLLARLKSVKCDFCSFWYSDNVLHSYFTNLLAAELDERQRVDVMRAAIMAGEWRVVHMMMVKIGEGYRAAKLKAKAHPGYWWYLFRQKFSAGIHPDFVD